MNNELETAQNALTWLSTLPPDETIACYRLVLRIAVTEYQRRIDTRPLTNDEFYAVRNAETVAVILRDELNEQCLSCTPLDEALIQFQQTLNEAEHKFPILRQAEIDAIVCAILNITPERLRKLQEREGHKEALAHVKTRLDAYRR